MSIITEMSVQKHNKKRVNVYIDGEFAGGLESIVAVENGLKSGGTIDRKIFERLRIESDNEAAFSRGVNYLSKRARTEKEISDYLSSREYPVTAVKYAIDKLKEYGYIDDKDFVKTYVETYSTRRGKRRMTQDLLRHGITSELVEESVGEIGEQREVALNIARKYLRTHEFDYKKLSAYLLSKGFEWDDVSHAVRSCGEVDDD